MILDIMSKAYKNYKVMAKKLGQYGGYLLSGILIAWLINPIAALAFIEIFLKMTLLIFIPVSGAYLIDKLILLKHQKAWNIILPTWIIISIYFSFKLIKLINRHTN